MDSDVTQTEIFYKLWTWFDLHKKHVMWAAIIIVVVGIAAGFFLWQQSARSARANEALSSAVSAELTPGQQAQSAEAILKVSTEYQGTDAAERAVLLAATDLFLQGKYVEARAQFEKYLREHRDGRFSIQARFGVAACSEAQGEIDKAIAAYKDIADHHASENVAPQAFVALGRLSEAQGKLEQARDYYGQAARDEIGTITSEARMRLQNLIARHPELIPTRPAVTPISPLNTNESTTVSVPATNTNMPPLNLTNQ